MTLNDLGLSLEIIGFIVFLFTPIRETFNLTLENGKKGFSDFMDNKTVRILGILLVFFGLVLQYDWVMNLVNSIQSIMASYPT